MYSYFGIFHQPQKKPRTHEAVTPFPLAPQPLATVGLLSVSGLACPGRLVEMEQRVSLRVCFPRRVVTVHCVQAGACTSLRVQAECCSAVWIHHVLLFCLPVPLLKGSPFHFLAVTSDVAVGSVGTVSFLLGRDTGLHHPHAGQGTWRPAHWPLKCWTQSDTRHFCHILLAGAVADPEWGVGNAVLSQALEAAD